MNAGEIGKEAGRIFEYKLPAHWIAHISMMGNLCLTVLRLKDLNTIYHSIYQ